MQALLCYFKIFLFHNYIFSSLDDLKISSSTPIKIFVMIQVEIALNVWTNLENIYFYKAEYFYPGTYHVFLLIQVF